MACLLNGTKRKLTGPPPLFFPPFFSPLDVRRGPIDAGKRQSLRTLIIIPHFPPLFSLFIPCSSSSGTQSFMKQLGRVDIGSFPLFFLPFPPFFLLECTAAIWWDNGWRGVKCYFLSPFFSPPFFCLLKVLLGKLDRTHALFPLSPPSQRVSPCLEKWAQKERFFSFLGSVNPMKVATENSLFSPPSSFPHSSASNYCSPQEEDSSIPFLSPPFFLFVYYLGVLSLNNL